MNIYLISQAYNKGYDTYDSAIVVARSEKEAQSIHPESKNYRPSSNAHSETWCSSEHVSVTLIGTLTNPDYKAGMVVSSSFNAG